MWELESVESRADFNVILCRLKDKKTIKTGYVSLIMYLTKITSCFVFFRFGEFITSSEYSIHGGWEILFQTIDVRLAQLLDACILLQFGSQLFPMDIGILSHQVPKTDLFLDKFSHWTQNLDGESRITKCLVVRVLIVIPHVLFN